MLSLRAIFDPRRFRGLLPIAALLSVFLVATDLLILAWIGPIAAGRINDDLHVIPWSDLEHAESQVNSLETALGDFGKPFIVYVGGSSANQGIDPAILQQLGPCHAPAMGLCTIGTSMSRLHELAKRLLRRQRLHPSLALLGVHALSLSGSYSEEPPNSLNPIAPLTHGDLRESARRIRWWNWFSINQAYTEHLALVGLLNIRSWLNFSPKISPWSPPELTLPEHETPEYLRIQMDGFRLKGCFDPARYLLHRDAEIGALEELLSQFQERRTEVIVVILPEESALRSRVPGEEQQFLIDSITGRFGSAAILNFRDAVPDEMFTDYAHLNTAGRAKFSLQLAQALRNRQSGKPCKVD